MATRQVGEMVVRNRLINGEMTHKTKAGAPLRDSFHKAQIPDEDWYVKKFKSATAEADLYYPESVLVKKRFNSAALGEDHSRRVFMELARQGRSHSEGSLLALQTDESVRRKMADKYHGLMRAPAGPPAATRPAMRDSASSAARGSASALRLPPVDEASPSPAAAAAEEAQGSFWGSRLSAQAPRGSRSQLSACPPAASQVSAGGGGEARGGSRLSACAPLAGSQLSACAPAASQLAASMPAASQLSAVRPDAESELPASQLSVSDFYAWRPRLIM
mmetsp:Transcript_61082/g.134343  ORF Transcript_61082/g.134343 Transcript_61082/m.134343 type:complete len:276 (-) Transcript_61082:49-876(-)